MEDQLDKILDWFYLSSEELYTPEAWRKHKAEAKAKITKLINEARIDELNNLKDHYATAYKKIARKHGQPAKVLNTAFHQLMYERIKQLDPNKTNIEEDK